MRRVMTLDTRTPSYVRAVGTPVSEPTEASGRAGMWVAVVVLTLIHLASPSSAVGLVAFLAVTAGAGVVAWWSVVRRPAGERAVVGLIAIGVCASGIAELVFVGETALYGAEPDVSFADVFWIGSYVFLIAAVLGRPGGRRPWSWFDADEAIDLVSSSVVILLLMGQFVDLGGLIRTDEVPLAVGMVWATYPALDAVLLAAMLRALLAGRHRGTSGVLLLFGVACWLASDYAYLTGVAEAAERWLNAGWMIGSAAIAAAVHSAALTRSEARNAGAVPIRNGRIALTLAPPMLPIMLLVAADARGDRPDPIPLALATVILTGCAYVRSARLARARDDHRARLAEQERYYRVMVENSSDAVLVVDVDGRIVRPATQLAAMLGDRRLPANAAELLDIFESEDRRRIVRAIHRLASAPAAHEEIEAEVVVPGGASRWFQLRGVNLLHDAAVAGIVINIVDVTRRKNAEIELTYLAFHDPLTRLPNRALFQERIEHELQRSGANGRASALIFLDVDGFKRANDRYGHATGDQLLRQLADRLTNAVGSGRTVARVGGDEFAVLIGDVDCPLDEARAVAARVLESLSVPLRADDAEMKLSVSLGLALSHPGATATSLLRDADVAMYRSKTDGKARMTVYDGDMRQATAERLEMEIDIVGAASNDELVLLYHPVVELGTGDVVGFEALVRWDHPQRGRIGPDRFIPVAESNGAIIDIGNWVLQHACRAAAGWQRRHPLRETTIAVNVSARQLAEPCFIASVAAALEASQLDPSRLILEMTETVLIEDLPTAASRLGQLRALGVRLAIDDFGTGYSSLSYLQQFPVDILKIDRSFTATIADRERIPPILHAMLDLGRALGLHIVAEGIENTDQLESLRLHRCEYGQGYLFSRPCSAELAESLIACPPATFGTGETRMLTRRVG